MAAVARRKTRKGDAMATFTLEDVEGSAEVVVFPELFGRSQAIFMEEPPVLVSGRLEADEFRTRILATEIVPLAEARKRRTESVSIRLPVSGVTRELVDRLQGVLSENRGECPVFLELTSPDAFSLTLRADTKFAASPTRRMVASVEEILGPGSVRLKGRRSAPAPGRSGREQGRSH